MSIYGKANEINECNSRNMLFWRGLAIRKLEICPKFVNGMVTIVIIINE